MNSHDLIRLIDAVEEIDGENTTLADALSFFAEHGDDTLAALRELFKRRKAAGDLDGCEVPE